MTRISLSFAIGALVALTASPLAAQSPGVTGQWRTKDDKAVVTIARCGNAVCGRITDILAATPNGPPHDDNNPDRSKRSRLLKGTTVLSGFRLDGDTYRGGTLYDPETGRTVTGRMQIQANGTLRVTGCVLGGAICRSQTWRRR